MPAACVNMVNTVKPMYWYALYLAVNNMNNGFMH